MSYALISGLTFATLAAILHLSRENQGWVLKTWILYDIRKDRIPVNLLRSAISFFNSGSVRGSVLEKGKIHHKLHILGFLETGDPFTHKID